MQPVVIGDVVWEPTPEVVERARLTQFMKRHGIDGFDALLRRSIDEPEWFWDALITDLGVRFSHPYDRVLDTSAGPEWPKWFTGGRINIVDTCLDRWLKGAEAQPDKLALIWEGEPGEVRRLSYRELNNEVCRLGGALRRLGVRPGDGVGVFLPMCPETAISLLAIAKIGAVIVPLFSGFGAVAVAARLTDAGARVLICADGFYRRGNVVKMKEVADEALRDCPSVEHVIVLRRIGREIPWMHGRDRVWDQMVETEDDHLNTHQCDPSDPIMVIYTSGTTGKPKGAVHCHAGFPVKGAQDLAWGFDAGREDTIFWITDIGWMMGPWLVFGTLSQGATMVLYEGTPDTPAADRMWRMIADHRVTIFGCAPTLIRALMSAGDDLPGRHDLSTLRIIGGTGEPWNPGPWLWFFEHVGGRRLPVINYTGGTEIAGGILQTNVLTPLRPCSFSGPIPGMAADVVDENGKGVRGQVGELVIRAPWVGMTNGFWKDSERYVSTYWSRFEGVWVHGDWAYIDPRDGLWYVLGRSDDTLKIAGKRLGPAEIESVIGSHPGVQESAAVGVPDELKGEALVVFVVTRPGAGSGPALEEELKAMVAQQMGKPLRPKAIYFVPDLPKTRNAKILRRVVKAVYLGLAPGDLTALENPASLEAIGAARV
ncbi:MAG: AMP-binding protein [Candidatus Dormibacteraeota bacterium]|nr:AMP-binding protein [Candidatus Dormibacteraeota bacterium]